MKGEKRRTPSPLYARIWSVVARIPRGRVATYGQIVALAGRAGQPRLAGYALRSAPGDLGLPWHRVINARGTISGRAGSIGTGEECLQRAMLEREGVRFDAAGRCDLARYQWCPSRIPYADSGPSSSGKRSRSATRTRVQS